MLDFDAHRGDVELRVAAAAARIVTRRSRPGIRSRDLRGSVSAANRAWFGKQAKSFRAKRPQEGGN